MHALCLLLLSLVGAANAEPAELNPFQKSYVALEISRNYPLSFSEQRFSPGTAEPAFTYLHDLDASWMMGLGAEFKVFERDRFEDKDPSSAYLATLTFSHEMLYVVRLNHPTYLFVGPKLLYMLPADSGRLPLQRDTDYELEIGGALTMQVVQLLGDDRMVTLRVDRWRGTKTQKLMGLEVAAGMAWAWR